MRGRKKSIDLDIKVPRQSTYLEPSRGAFPTPAEEPRLSQRERFRQAKKIARHNRRLKSLLEADNEYDYRTSSKPMSRVKIEKLAKKQQKQATPSTPKQKAPRQTVPKAPSQNEEPRRRGKDRQKRKTRSDKGVKRGSRQNQQKKEYPNEADIIIDNLLMLIDRLDNADTSWGYTKSGQISYKRPLDLIEESEQARENLLNLIRDQVNMYGMEMVAKRLETLANYGEINELVETMLHSFYIEQIRSCYQRLASIVKGEMLTARETQYWGDVDSSLDGNYEPE